MNYSKKKFFWGGGSGLRGGRGVSGRGRVGVGGQGGCEHNGSFCENSKKKKFWGGGGSGGGGVGGGGSGLSWGVRVDVNEELKFL